MLAVWAGLGAGMASAAVSEETVREAITRAVAQRVGPQARVVVRDLEVRLADEAEGSVFATIPADAKGSAPVRVVLKVLRGDGRVSRFGEATCLVDAVVDGVRAARPISRGEVLQPGDVVAAEVETTGLPLMPLPTDLEGARATTDIPAGQVVRGSMVVPAPLVRTGDEVALTLRTGLILVEARGIAAQTGRLGDVIHVVAPGTKRRIAARVTGRGLAEVQHGR